MSRGEKMAWRANMRAVLAEETLRENGGALDPQQLYTETLISTGDEQLADRLRSRRWLQQNAAR